MANRINHLVPKFVLGLMVGQLFTLGVSTFTGVAASEKFSYLVTDLGTLGGNYIEANAINDAGQVVGASTIKTNRNEFVKRAFFWEKGKMTDLGTFGGKSSVAYDINNQGKVIGQADLPDENGALRVAFSWEKGKGLREFQTLGGSSNFASSINNKDQIVGQSSTSTGTSRAFLLSLSGWNITNLGTLNNQKFSNATSINHRGQIVGYSANDDSASKCVLWENLTITGTFGSEYSYCYPKAINNAGQVVGNGSSSAGVTRGFLWEKGKQKSQDLGTLGGKSTYVRGINNIGKVVGTSDSYSGKPRAFVWVKGKMFDLNKFLPKNSGWELIQASAINNRGEIVGTGTFKGQPRAFLLTPVTVIGR